jgi:hypothetical protein
VRGSTHEQTTTCVVGYPAPALVTDNTSTLKYTLEWMSPRKATASDLKSKRVPPPLVRTFAPCRYAVLPNPRGACFSPYYTSWYKCRGLPQSCDSDNSTFQRQPSPDLLHVVANEIMDPTMNRCILFDLPEAISRHVLVEWINFNALTRLDSAFCVRGARTLFLAIAYDPCNVFASVQRCVRIRLRSVLEWAVTRKVQLDGIDIDSQFPLYHSLLAQYLTTSGSAISWVKLLHIE